MNNISELTSQASRQVIAYGEKLLDGITPELFGVKPELNGKIIQINPPAFQYGHLSLYPTRICGLFGISSEKVKVQEDFTNFFKKGSESFHDPEGTIYPKMDLIISAFTDSHKALLQILPDIADPEYLKPNLEQASKDRFPTIGSFVIYLLTAHMNTHFGQVCAWRRAVGLPGVA